MLKRILYSLIILLFIVSVGCEQGIEEVQVGVDKQLSEAIEEFQQEEPVPEQEKPAKTNVEPEIEGTKEERKDKPVEKSEEPREPKEQEELTEPEEPIDIGETEEQEEQEEQEETKKEMEVGTGVFIWPLKGEYKVFRKFGEDGNVFCTGIRISAPEGAPVYAADSGTVSLSGFRAGYGNLIVLNHNNGFQTCYAHVLKSLVSEGDNVKKGDKIAEVGRSGTSVVHLHFEVRKNGNAVNPENYLPRS